MSDVTRLASSFANAVVDLPAVCASRTRWLSRLRIIMLLGDNSDIHNESKLRIFIWKEYVDAHSLHTFCSCWECHRRDKRCWMMWPRAAGACLWLSGCPVQSLVIATVRLIAPGPRMYHFGVTPCLQWYSEAWFQTAECLACPLPHPLPSLS